MFASLVIAAALTGQAPTPPPATPSAAAARATAARHRADLIRQRQGAAELKRRARVQQQIAAQYAAQEQMLHEERMAPLYLQQQQIQAQAYYQARSAAALENLGIAARQDAETRRFRAVQEFGPGYFVTPPRVVTPGEVIQSQLGPR